MPAGLVSRLNQSHIPGLDGLRAVAVLMVVFYHLGFTYVPGGYGVTIFFVISGFLITWLLLKEQARTGTVSLSSFYKRRGLRIFPAFMFYWVALIVLLIATGRQVPWSHALSALFYVSNYYNAILGDPNTGFSHTWSLAIEEQFYIIWPVTFLILVRNPERASARLIALILTLWLYRALLVYVLEVDQAYIYAAFDTRFDALLCGCTLATLLHQGRLARLWSFLISSPLWPVLTITAIALGIFLGDWLSIPRYRDVIGFSAVPPLVALLIVQFIALSGSPMWQWIEFSAIRYIGRISYSMYLWQQLTTGISPNNFDELPPSSRTIVILLATVLIASASYYFVERPILRFKGGHVPARAGRRSTLSSPTV